VIEIEAKAIKVGQPTEDEEKVRVERLWGRVLEQAVAEAEGRQLYGVPRLEVEGVVRRARRWLITDSRSFRETCRYAGLPTEAMKAILANAHDSAWRKRFLETFKKGR
jgi:hypothetical protein